MFRGDFMRTFKKIAALLLALSLAAGLAACGGAPQEQELPAPDEPDAVETVGEGLVSTLVIKQEELPGGLAELSAMNTAGEGLILAGWDAAASPVRQSAPSRPPTGRRKRQPRQTPPRRTKSNKFARAVK